MQNKKNIILIAIAIILLGIAGFVVFKIFNRKSVDPVSIGSGKIIGDDNVTKGVSTILPHGNQLDLTQIKKYNSDEKLYNYPVVTPEQVGVNLSELIKPPTPAK